MTLAKVLRLGLAAVLFAILAIAVLSAVGPGIIDPVATAIHAGLTSDCGGG